MKTPNSINVPGILRINLVRRLLKVSCYSLYAEVLSELNTPIATISRLVKIPVSLFIVNHHDYN